MLKLRVLFEGVSSATLSITQNSGGMVDSGAPLTLSSTSLTLRTLDYSLCEPIRSKCEILCTGNYCYDLIQAKL